MLGRWGQPGRRRGVLASDGIEDRVQKLIVQSDRCQEHHVSGSWGLTMTHAHIEMLDRVCYRWLFECGYGDVGVMLGSVGQYPPVKTVTKLPCQPVCH